MFEFIFIILWWFPILYLGHLADEGKISENIVIGCLFISFVLAAILIRMLHF